MLLRQLFEAIDAGQGPTAVLGWGRGMGHKGHMLLAKAVLHHAKELNAKPYFVVSRTSLVDPSTGQPWTDKPTFTKTKDDPLTPDEKLNIYRKVFPGNAEVFSVTTADATKLEQVMAKIARDGYKNIVLVVGEDQKDSMGYLTRPDKSGVPPFKQAGVDSLQIISRQDTSEPSSQRGSPEYQEGPRATPMRKVLNDLAAFKAENPQYANVPDDKLPFQVWRAAMPDELDDAEVMDLMNKAKQRMAAVPASKRAAKGVTEGSLKEISRRGFLKGLGAATVAGYGADKIIGNWYEVQGEDGVTAKVQATSAGDAIKKAQTDPKFRNELFKNSTEAKRLPFYSPNQVGPNNFVGNPNYVRPGDSESTVYSILGKPSNESISTYQGLEIKRWIYKGKSMFGTDAVIINFLNGKVSDISKPGNNENIEQSVTEAKGKLTYTPEPTEYGVFPDNKNEFVKTFLSKDLALAHIKKFGGKLVVLDQYGRRMKQGVAEGLNEMDKSAPQPGRDGKVSHSTYGSRDKKGSDYFKGKEAPGKPITKKQMSKDALNILKKQGVAEILTLSEAEAGQLGSAVFNFYKSFINKIHKEKVADYASQAQDLANQVTDPKLKSKVIGILKKGAENPSLQGSIITAVAAILTNLVLSSGSKYGLTPQQTGIALQVVLNTAIPTITSKLYGKDWMSTLKTVASSVGTGASIAAVLEKAAMEDESPVIKHMVKDIENPPVIMQRRAQRDQERLQQYKDSQRRRDDDEDLDEKMMSPSSFAGYPKNKLGPAAHLKETMKRPAHSGDLVGGAEESIETSEDLSRRGFLKGLAGAAALGATGMAAAGDYTPLTPGVERVGHLTLKYNGKVYTYAGRGARSPEQGEVITVSAGDIGLRGGHSVKVTLASDGKYYVYLPADDSRENKGVPVSEDVELIMSALIEKIIVNEAIQNHKS